MIKISSDRIRQIEARFAELEARLASGQLEGDEFVAASREYSEMEAVAKAAQNVRRLRAEIDTLDAMTKDASADGELREMAVEELQDVTHQLSDAEQFLAVQLLPRDSADDRPAMLEIRAGTGGDEAALFAGDLFRMYARYAENQGWSVDMISANASEVGGFKEVVASIKGKGVFAKLKFESGVHRVQRVPETESGGRIHTSAATVAILPEPEEVDINIRSEDLRIDTYRASGAGGQHVNKTDSAIRITHLPTGLVVTCQDGKSQHKNKAQAMKVLGVRLYERERIANANQEADARKLMVGSGDRSERIRTYNFPQGRVTDHRINLTLHKLPEILEGDMGDMIGALIAEDQAERMAGLNEG
jgi:peptide chain release factor 1